MSVEKMGLFILELRKSHKMTQKELAAKLNISDKAVSKWERGLSCPDIFLLAPLADILGVTTTELLNGARSDSSSIDVEVIVNNALEYGENTVRRKIELNRNMIAAVFSVLLLIGIFVVLIVDVTLSGGFSWSLIPISAIAFAWLVLFPAIKLGARGIALSLAAVSVFIIPFLYALDYVIGRLTGADTMIFLIGIRIAPLSAVFFWLAYILLKKLRNRVLLVIAVLMLALIPMNYFINNAIANLLNRSRSGAEIMLNTFTPLIVAAILFIAEFTVRKGKRYTP